MKVVVKVDVDNLPAYIYIGEAPDHIKKEAVSILDKQPEAISLKIGDSGGTHTIKLKKI